MKIELIIEVNDKNRIQRIDVNSTDKTIPATIETIENVCKMVLEELHASKTLRKLESFNIPLTKTQMN